MAIPNFIEGAAFGVLNDILSVFRSNEGYAQPNRYEVVILGPAKLGGGGQQNIFSNQERQSDARSISLRAQSVTLPGRNLSTAQESNVYGPNREIVEGVTYADDITVQFQASSGLDERVFFENWQKQAFNEKTWNLVMNSLPRELHSGLSVLDISLKYKIDYGLLLHYILEWESKGLVNLDHSFS